MEAVSVVNGDNVAGSLALACGPCTDNTSQARRLLGSSGIGQSCRFAHATACSHRALPRRAPTACSYTACAQLDASHRHRSPPTPSLLFRPRPTRSSPRCRSRKGAGLPPAPPLRGPRSTTSPRSRPGRSTWALGVPSSPRTRSAAHSQHRACAHEVHPPKLPAPMHNLRRASLHFLEAGARTRDGRCREVDRAGSTMPSTALTSAPLCLSPLLSAVCVYNCVTDV